MEQALCNLCASRNFSFFRKVECSSPKRADFTLVQCKDCGLIYLNPRPAKEEMQEFYQFWQGQPPDALEARLADSYVWKIQQNKLNRLRKYIKGIGKVLDIGTGTGEFLSLMKERGWEVFGVEYGKVSSEFARDSLHLNVLTQDLLDTNLESKYFDLITFWDSLEHLPGPKEALKEANRILKDDGLLVLSCPNIDNLASLIFKNYWYTNSPRHLYQFTPQTIQLLLANTDFKAFKIAYNAGFFEPVGFAVTLKSWIVAKLRKYFKREIKAEVSQENNKVSSLPYGFKAILRLILEFICLPLSLLSMVIGKGPNMVIFAKKC